MAWSKKLSKEFKINISSEGQKDVKNVYKQMEEIWKNNIQGKRNAFKNEI